MNSLEKNHETAILLQTMLEDLMECPTAKFGEIITGEEEDKRRGGWITSAKSTLWQVSNLLFSDERKAFQARIEEVFTPMKERRDKAFEEGGRALTEDEEIALIDIILAEGIERAKGVITDTRERIMENKLLAENPSNHVYSCSPGFTTSSSEESSNHPN